MSSKSTSEERVPLGRMERCLAGLMGKAYGIEGPGIFYPLLRSRARKRFWAVREEYWAMLPVLLLVFLERWILVIPGLTWLSFTALCLGVSVGLLVWVGTSSFQMVHSMKSTGMLQELLVTPLGAHQILYDIHLLLRRRVMPVFILSWVVGQYFDIRGHRYGDDIFSVHLLIFMWGASTLGVALALRLIDFPSPGEILLAFLLFFFGAATRLLLWVALPLALMIPPIWMAWQKSPAAGWVLGIVLGTGALILACVGLLRTSGKSYAEADRVMNQSDRPPDYVSIDL